MNRMGEEMILNDWIIVQEFLLAWEFFAKHILILDIIALALQNEEIFLLNFAVFLNQLMYQEVSVPL
jgi:hypothetical protein